MKIEVLYTTGCASHQLALDHLRRALRDTGMDVPIEQVAVDSDADAQAMRFPGSPTIRIDGIDVEGATAEAGGFGCNCRVYRDAGSETSYPSVDLISRALRAHGSTQ